MLTFIITRRIIPLVVLAALVGCATLQVSNPPPPKEVGVYDVAEVDSIPRPIQKTPPDYPVWLRRDGVAGQTLILVTVGADGSVTDAVVLNASDILFGDAAVEAIRKWRYTPAILHGKAVACRLTEPCNFSVVYVKGKKKGGISLPRDAADARFALRFVNECWRALPRVLVRF